MPRASVNQVGHVPCASDPIRCATQVLNLIIFRLRKRPYDEAQLAFLAVDEHLVDIGDDLCERLQLHTMLTMPMSCVSASRCLARDLLLSVQMTTRMTYLRTLSMSFEVCAQGCIPFSMCKVQLLIECTCHASM